MASDVGSSTNSSKTSQRKRTKNDASTTAVTSDDVAPPLTGASIAVVEAEPHANGADAHESIYVKDLQRNVRNVTKKLVSVTVEHATGFELLLIMSHYKAAMQKVDSVVAENPNTSLDDLVASRKINADQKAQALKKPGLQAYLAQLEEQIAVFKKLEHDFETRLSNEKERLESWHKIEVDSMRTMLEEDGKATQANAIRSALLTISTFLRAAAARRAVEDETTEESQAFEGLLMELYGGDAAAVDAAEKLINGSSDKVKSTERDALSVTYGRVKELSGEVPPGETDSGRVQPEDAGREAPPDYGEVPAYAAGAGTDHTIVNAGLTELDAKQTSPEHHVPSHSGQSTIDAGAANANAATHWDAAPAVSGDPMADSWVSVPRPADETEQQPAAAALGGTNSWDNKNDTNDSSNNVAGNWGDAGNAVNKGAWADEASEIPVNDGFREVHHHHRGGRGRGGAGGAGFEGRGGGGGRGRGRGGPRGEFRGGRGRGGRARGRGDAAAANAA